MYGEDVSGSEAGSGYLRGVQIVGKVVLNLYRPHVRDLGGLASMKTLDGMKVTVPFTIRMVIQPHMKVRSSWMAGFFRLYRVLMCL